MCRHSMVKGNWNWLLQSNPHLGLCMGTVVWFWFWNLRDSSFSIPTTPKQLGITTPASTSERGLSPVSYTSGACGYVATGISNFLHEQGLIISYIMISGFLLMWHFSHNMEPQECIVKESLQLPGLYSADRWREKNAMPSISLTFPLHCQTTMICFSSSHWFILKNR